MISLFIWLILGNSFWLFSFQDIFLILVLSTYSTDQTTPDPEEEAFDCGLDFQLGSANGSQLCYGLIQVFSWEKYLTSRFSIHLSSC